MESNRSQISFLILLSFLTSSIAFAVGNPTGKFGDGGKEWDPSWSDTFFKCWQNQRQGGSEDAPVEAAFKKGLSDVGPGKKWCTAAKLQDGKDIQLMMLSTLKALCKPESSCNPNSVNPNGTNEPAIGLFQIGVEDATKKHKCKDEHGTAISGEADLKDPKKNICCAIQIANDVAGGRDSNNKSSGGGKDSGAFATGKTGIMAAFWQPMREGTSSGGGSDGKGSVDNSKNSDKIKEDVNKSCQAIARGGYSAEGNLTEQEFSQASGGSSSPFGSSGGFFGGK